MKTGDALWWGHSPQPRGIYLRSQTDCMVPGSPREAAREQGGGFASRDEPLPQCPPGMGQLAHKEPWDMQVHIDPLVLFLPQQSSPWHPPRSFLRPTLPTPSESPSPISLHCTCPLVAHWSQYRQTQRPGRRGRTHGLGLFSVGNTRSQVFMVGGEDGICVELSGDRGLLVQSEVYSFPLRLLGDNSSRGSIGSGLSPKGALTSHPTSPSTSQLWPP